VRNYRQKLTLEAIIIICPSVTTLQIPRVSDLQSLYDEQQSVSLQNESY